MKEIPGYFEFTSEQRHDSDLDHWRDWLAYKGIKTQTVKTKRGYTLYREGTPAEIQKERA